MLSSIGTIQKDDQQQLSIISSCSPKFQYSDFNDTNKKYSPIVKQLYKEFFVKTPERLSISPNRQPSPNTRNRFSNNNDQSVNQQELKQSKAYLSAMKALQSKIKTMENSIHNLEDNKNSLLQQLDQKNKEIEQYNNQLKQQEHLYQEQIEANQQAISQEKIIFQQLEQNLIEKLKQVEKNNFMLNKQFETINLEATKNKEKLQLVDKKYKEQQIDIEIERKQMKENILNIQNNIEELSKQNQQVQSEYSAAIEMKKHLESTIRRLEENNNLICKEQEKLKLEFQLERRSLNEKIENDLILHRQQIDILNEEKQRLQKDFDASKMKYEELRKINQELKENNRQSEIEMTIMRQKIASLEREGQSFKAYSDATKDVNNKLLNSIITSNQQNKMILSERKFHDDNQQQVDQENDKDFNGNISFSSREDYQLNQKMKSNSITPIKNIKERSQSYYQQQFNNVCKAQESPKFTFNSDQKQNNNQMTLNDLTSVNQNDYTRTYKKVISNQLNYSNSSLTSNNNIPYQQCGYKTLQQLDFYQKEIQDNVRKILQNQSPVYNFKDKKSEYEFTLQSILDLEKELIEVNHAYSKISEEFKNFNGDEVYVNLMKKRMNEFQQIINSKEDQLKLFKKKEEELALLYKKCKDQ